MRHTRFRGARRWKHQDRFCLFRPIGTPLNRHTYERIYFSCCYTRGGKSLFCTVEKNRGPSTQARSERKNVSLTNPSKTPERNTSQGTSPTWENPTRKDHALHSGETTPRCGSFPTSPELSPPHPRQEKHKNKFQNPSPQQDKAWCINLKFRRG